MLLLMQIKHLLGFEWGKFWQQARYADPKRIGLALAIIYICYALRAVRWAILLRPTKKVTAPSLLGAQFIGFTAAALFGRLGELARPYLIARQVNLPLSSQLAVYAVERMLDLASVATIFSLTLELSPSINALPHHKLFHRIGFIGLGLALAIGVFAWVLRVSGDVAGVVARRILGLMSQRAGEWAKARILAFRGGLNVISSFREFVAAIVVSLAMWTLIAYSYMEITHSFVTDPVLSVLSFPRCMLLLAAGVVGSIVQLPFIGGGSQMATAAAMKMLFGVAIEPAVACSIMQWLVSIGGVVPAGLIWARFEHVSLKRIALES